MGLQKKLKEKFRKTELYKKLKAGPLGRVSLRVRLANWFVHRVIYGKKNMSFSYHFTSVITRHDRVVVGRNVEMYLANVGGMYIQGINGVEIGDDTMIAPGVKIISANHNLENFEKHDYAEPVRIGKKCWLGTNCVILPGVQLGNGVIVGAGAVVTKSFPDNCVIGGIPAKIMKMRNAEGCSVQRCTTERTDG